jgi:hypothetical protein
MTPLYKTILVVTWGYNQDPEQRLYFQASEQADAAYRFSEKIIELQADTAKVSAYVTLERLPDGKYPDGCILCFWTKSKGYTRIAPGVASVDALPSFTPRSQTPEQ